jgi:hypothetical protein
VPSPMKRLIYPLLAMFGTLIVSDGALAYRPFDFTDAAVADLDELEIEFGPVGYRQSPDERTLIGPSYVVNYGFAKSGSSWLRDAESIRNLLPTTSAADGSAKLSP